MSTVMEQEEIQRFRSEGLLFLDAVFAGPEMDIIRRAFEHDCEAPGPHRIVEGSGAVRALYASHHREPAIAALVTDPRILGRVRELIGEDEEVYVYQLKVNSKPPFGGERWAWHQDFSAWKLCDGLPAPRQINVAIFLDAVDDQNGPIKFVPGSHRNGLIRKDRNAEMASPQHLDPSDIELSADVVQKLVEELGVETPIGQAGAVVFFDSEVVHGSEENRASIPRRILLITYNATNNLPNNHLAPRAEYLVGRDTTPLQIGLPLLEMLGESKP